MGAQMTQPEVDAVSNAVVAASIQLENTRILKRKDLGQNQYDVLQASVEVDTTLKSNKLEDIGTIRIVRGDHSKELAQICESVRAAQENAGSSVQKRYLSSLVESMQNGDMEIYKQALRDWVQDLQPSVETTLGFVEPYRDPYGVRAEFEGLVGILQKKQTKLLSKLVENADRFISSLPWIGLSDENDGKGPFELAAMGYRDFTSVSSRFGRTAVSQNLADTPP